jgi:glutamate-1-semialdehyde 2,1-aminomutase
MAAGCAALDALRDGAAYAQLERVGARLAQGLHAAADEAGIPCAVNRIGSMLTPFLGVDTVANYDDAKRADMHRFATLHAAWLDGGVFWPPSQFEAAFLSTAHTDADVDRVIDVAAHALSER